MIKTVLILICTNDFHVAEVSDQNFVDEDREVGNGSSDCSNAKRVNTPETNALINEQVIHMIST